MTTNVIVVSNTARPLNQASKGFMPNIKTSRNSVRAVSGFLETALFQMVEIGRILAYEIDFCDLVMATLDHFIFLMTEIRMYVCVFINLTRSSKKIGISTIGLLVGLDIGYGNVKASVAA